MAKLVFGMNQSLDGYVDHLAFAPGRALFRHFVREAEGQAGSVYGRHMYGIMRYWDDEHPEWNADERAFAAAWRNQPKWVVSRTLRSVGPNASLVGDDLEGAIRALKAERHGEIGSRRPRPRAKPRRARPDRRISNLPAPGRAWPRQTLFRRTPPAAPPAGARPDRRGRDQADLRPRLTLRYGPGTAAMSGGFEWVALGRSPPMPVNETRQAALPPIPAHRRHPSYVI